MFAHLNQNLMNNFSLRYIHECGTFDCRYDRCILFGIFALHFCKTRTFVTLGYDALSSCTEINTIFRALCTYQWPWPMQKSNLISSVLFFFFFFFFICRVEGEPSFFFFFFFFFSSFAEWKESHPVSYHRFLIFLN